MMATVMNRLALKDRVTETFGDKLRAIPHVLFLKRKSLKHTPVLAIQYLKK